jgi:ABC-type glycerol-3-phosphate transport system permease component
VVRKARVLDVEVDTEAEIPYGETRLAQQAPRARRRLAGVLAVSALLMAVNAVADRSAGWALGAAAALALAWGVRRASLGAVVGAALLALLAVLVPLRLLFVAERDLGTYATLAVALVFGAACLPDVILLFRDAELQSAYGMWARREGP